MSEFWMGYLLGILTIFVLCFVAVIFKGPYLQIKSNKFMTQVMNARLERLKKKASKPAKKKR